MEAGNYVAPTRKKDGKFVGSIKVSVPGGGTLASGAQVGAGQSVDVPFNVPASALDGHQFSLTVGGVRYRCA